MSTPSERRKLGLPPVNLSASTPGRLSRAAAGPAADRPAPADWRASSGTATPSASAERHLQQPAAFASPAAARPAEQRQPQSWDGPDRSPTWCADSPASRPAGAAAAGGPPADAGGAGTPATARAGARPEETRPRAEAEGCAGGEGPAPAGGAGGVPAGSPELMTPQPARCVSFGAIAAAAMERAAAAGAKASATEEGGAPGAPAAPPAPPPAKRAAAGPAAPVSEAALPSEELLAPTPAASEPALASPRAQVGAEEEAGAEEAAEEEAATPAPLSAAPPPSAAPAEAYVAELRTPPPAAPPRAPAEIAWSSPGVSGLVECRMPLFALAQLRGLREGGRSGAAEGQAGGWGEGGEAGLSILGGGGGSSRTGIPNAIAAATVCAAPMPPAGSAALPGGGGSAVLGPVRVAWSASVEDGAVYALAAHPTRPWLCVASARSLQLWAPRADGGISGEGGEGAGGSSQAPLAAVEGSRVCLSGLPPLSQLRADGQGGADQATGAPAAASDPHARDAAAAAAAAAAAEEEEEEDGGAAEISVVAFGAHGSEGGLLLVGTSDGRLFAFHVSDGALADGGARGGCGPLLSLLWARRTPQPPAGGSASACAVASLAICAGDQPAQSKLAAVDGAGRLWLLSLLAPAQPAQLFVPPVAPAAARGRRGRRPAVPRLKTILLCRPCGAGASAGHGGRAGAEPQRLIGLISAAGQSTWAVSWRIDCAQAPHAAAAAAAPARARRVCAHSHTAGCPSADGRSFLLGSGEGCITLVDAASLRPLASVQGAHSLPVTAVLALPPPAGRAGAVRCLSASADKRCLASVLTPSDQSRLLLVALAVLVALLAVALAFVQAGARPPS